MLTTILSSQVNNTYEKQNFDSIKYCTHVKKKKI